MNNKLKYHAGIFLDWFVIIIVLLLIVGLGFLIRYFSLATESFFAPREANVKRMIYENTDSYVKGKAQELAKLKLEYLREKDPIAKEAIANMIRHNFAGVPTTGLSPDEAAFLKSLMR